MQTQNLANALQRAKTVLQRRPDMGLHDDAPAIARLEGGTRVVSQHANGTEVTTDMPPELGGSGEQVTPGWLFRAGLASCAATCIAMTAATEGIQLELLEVQAGSRSDTRGVLGMAEADGEPVFAGARDVSLQIKVRAAGASSEALQRMVERSLSCSPVPASLLAATPLALQLDVDAG